MSIFDSIISALGLSQPDPEQDQVAPLVIVKILDSVILTAIDQGSTLTLDALKSQAAASDSIAYTLLAAKFSDLVFGWAFTSVTTADLAALVSRATDADPSYAAPKFDHFFEIVCDQNFDTAGLAAALTSWTDVIEYAYESGTASDPLITGGSNPLFFTGGQDYFSAAPIGINVAAAWAKGADGTGVHVIDIEQGWFTKQEDMPAGFSILNAANNKVSSQAHGAAVAGIIAARDNTLGIIGAAPAASVSGSSYNDPKAAATAPVNVQRVADRIVNAAVILPAGSVLLLEVQIVRKIAGTKFLLPVETDPLGFEAIKLAVAAGITTVEAAGNGHADLESWVMDVGPNAGKKTLSRATPADFQDSGAIMVGAATSVSPHTKLNTSNFGSRLDCYAWGQNMITSGWDSEHPALTNIYWGVNQTEVKSGVRTIQFFGGTSGASPVIVGCAVLMQHLSSLLTRQDGKTGMFNPPTMRSILSTAANGTVSSDPIGVMPDFQKLLANLFAP